MTKNKKRIKQDKKNKIALLQNAVKAGVVILFIAVFITFALVFPIILYHYTDSEYANNEKIKTYEYVEASATNSYTFEEHLDILISEDEYTENLNLIPIVNYSLQNEYNNYNEETQQKIEEVMDSCISEFTVWMDNGLIKGVYESNLNTRYFSNIGLYSLCSFADNQCYYNLWVVSYVSNNLKFTLGLDEEYNKIMFLYVTNDNISMLGELMDGYMGYDTSTNSAFLYDVSAGVSPDLEDDSESSFVIEGSSENDSIYNYLCYAYDADGNLVSYSSDPDSYEGLKEFNEEYDNEWLNSLADYYELSLDDRNVAAYDEYLYSCYGLLSWDFYEKSLNASWYLTTDYYGTNYYIYAGLDSIPTYLLPEKIFAFQY